MAEKAEKKISPKAPEKSDAGEQAAVRVTKTSLRKITRRRISHRRVSHRKALGH